VVYCNDTNVNLEMVKVGLAEVYRGRPAKGFDNGPYEKAEKEARESGRGMWSLGDKYMSPKEWRNRE
jgi:endonuclease YncB( thermonuclease family)